MMRTEQKNVETNFFMKISIDQHSLTRRWFRPSAPWGNRVPVSKKKNRAGDEGRPVCSTTAKSTQITGG